MSIIVQKYGGTSVADAGRIKHAAGLIAATHDRGHQVVAVVSAMGATTDQLIELAGQVSPSPEPRELDLLLSTGEIVACTLLAMALQASGYTAVSLSGAQAGIRTDTAHNRARITGLEPERVNRELERGSIVIVAGFQGATSDMDITTLGRGASDLTAVALAAGLQADRCEIYTDVEGIYTADPGLVPDARKLAEIGFEEMLELASYGAKMHPRSIELAAAYNIPVLVRSSFVDSPGTLIHGEADVETANKVRSVAADGNVAKITVLGVPDQPGIASAVFTPLADQGISVDTIVQNASVERVTDLTFTVSSDDLERALAVAEPVAKAIGARGCVGSAGLAKVSIVGTGMQNSPGVAATMFQTLSETGVNIEMITTAEIRITCIIEEAMVPQAVRALHAAFHLDQQQ